MDIGLFSKDYFLKKLSDENIDDIYNICVNNTIYYKYCPPNVSIESIKRDMMALPPNKTYEDKYYIGFYKENKLIAIMDLIVNFPMEKIAFIGFFMMSKNMQHKGIGSKIITDICEYLKSVNFNEVRLGYVKGNIQSETFWLKNNFVKTGKESLQEKYTVIIMSKKL